MGNGTSYSTVNSLDEFTLIGGNDFTIIFNVVDEAGLPVDLTNAQELSLKISPYGQATSVLMTLSGVIGETNDIVKFTIPANLSERMIGGKYMYQPIIKDAEGKQHRPKQGTFLLVQSIGTFTDLVDVPSSAFYVLGSGTNTYTAESNVITQYYDGLTIILHVENTNTLASTLTFDNAPGTRDIKKFTSSGDIVDLSAGDLVEGKKYLLVYDGIQWISISTFDSGGGGTFYVYATGTDSYTGTSTEINQYFAGLSAIMYFQNTNTGASTLTLPGVAGTKSLMKFNSSGTLVELIAGDILQNKKYLFLYDGTQWVYVGYFPSEISHTKLTDIGTNTHAQIDTFIGTTVPSNYAPIASPQFTGTPRSPTASTGDSTTQIATTAFVNAEINNDRPYSDTNPLMNGTAAQGSSARISRQDHVHPVDTSRQPLNSDLTSIAGLTPENNDIIQRKAGAWTNRTMEQLRVDLDPTAGSRKPFRVDGTNTLGFDTAANPYVPSSPFSAIKPAANHNFSASGGLLTMRNWDGSSPLYLKWTSATAVSQVLATVSLSPTAYALDTHLFEIRGWAVQSPGASDKYWAVKWSWLGASRPQYPLCVSMYAGTGVTLTLADGTASGLLVPSPIGMPLLPYLRISGGSALTDIWQAGGSPFYSFSAIGGGGLPASFKEVWFLMAAGAYYHQVFIDDVYLV